MMPEPGDKLLGIYISPVIPMFSGISVVVLWGDRELTKFLLTTPMPVFFLLGSSH